jgi:apolipoprotein N-acyltransferase
MDTDARNSRSCLKDVRFWIKAAACAASAFLLWAAFPPRGELYNVAFALAPMLAISRLSSRPGRAAAWWFAFGWAHWLAVLEWLPAIIKNGGPWPLVLLGWVALAAACGGYFALFGWLDARLWRGFATRSRAAKIAVLVVAEPALWAGTEWLRATLFSGFAWNFLGTALVGAPSLAAPARLGGVYLLSALALLLNGVFATLICRIADQMSGAEEKAAARGTGRLMNMLETALPLAVILLALWCAPALDHRVKGGTAYLPVKVALVQRNAPCFFSRAEKDDPMEVYDRLLTAAAAAKPDMVVFAESAMSEFGRIGGDSAHHAAQFFSRRCGDAAVLAGGDWRTPEDRLWNAAALWRFDGYAATNSLALQVYGKQHLVPFGEYIFLDKWITPLQKLSPIGVSLWPGEAALLELGLKETGPMATPSFVRLAPLICYEDTDPRLAVRSARMGAQAIVLITNDSWFSHSAEAEQHAAQAILRAVETGLPIIRVGNSGVTGVISPSGRARWLSDGAGKPLVDAAGCQLETVLVPADPHPTPYVRLGDWPMLSLFAVALALAFVKRSKVVA